MIAQNYEMLYKGTRDLMNFKQLIKVIFALQWARGAGRVIIIIWKQSRLQDFTVMAESVTCNCTVLTIRLMSLRKEQTPEISLKS